VPVFGSATVSVFPVLNLGRLSAVRICRTSSQLLSHRHFLFLATPLLWSLSCFLPLDHPCYARVGLEEVGNLTKQRLDLEASAYGHRCANLQALQHWPSRCSTLKFVSKVVRQYSQQTDTSA
jgi:hypothetical protein